MSIRKEPHEKTVLVDLVPAGSKTVAYRVGMYSKRSNCKIIDYKIQYEVKYLVEFDDGTRDWVGAYAVEGA